MRTIILGIFTLLLSTTVLAEERSKELQSIEIIEMGCKIQRPNILCSCMSDEMKTRISGGESTLQEIIDSEAENIVTKCMVTTGLARKLMDDFSLACYMGGPDKLASIDVNNRNVSFLKEKYPDKIKECECVQNEIDKLNEEVFIKISTEAYQNYQKKVECKMNNIDDSCTQFDKKTPMNEIENKCGLS